MKELIEKYASHMNNIASTISCYQLGVPKYQSIPKHVIDSMQASLELYHQAYDVHCNDIIKTKEALQ